MSATERDLAAEAKARGLSVASLMRIKELVADWPPLSAETKARLSVLLRRPGNEPRARAA